MKKTNLYVSTMLQAISHIGQSVSFVGINVSRRYSQSKREGNKRI